MTENYVPRKRTLTEADMKELKTMFIECHPCRFDNISKEDMDFLKDLLNVYKETRSEVIRWIIKGIVWMVGVVILIGVYFKFSGKH